MLIGLFAYGTGTASEPMRKVVLEDPSGDDKGPGSYTYPTHSVYKPKSFDLRKLTVLDKGTNVEFRVEVGARIGDPWRSKEWDGNGFSLQFVQIYIDTTAGRGFTKPLPGLGAARFAATQAWDKVVLISPQGKAKLSSELKYKARKMRADVIIPKSTRARGKKLIAVVNKRDLGGPPNKSWGLQAVVQSNEGFAKGRDILTRRVNEIRGEHRFGGGHDSDCDPHVIDIFAGAAKGEASEAKAQYETLAYTCGSKIATLPMVYPFGAGR